MMPRVLGMGSMWLLCGCGAASAGARQVDLPRAAQRCDAEKIAALQVTDAWEVIGRCNLGLVLEEARDMSSAQIRTRRGRSSILLRGSNVPVILVDGLRLSDARELHLIAADALVSVELLSGIEGTTVQGTNAGAGVLVVRTRSGPAAETTSR